MKSLTYSFTQLGKERKKKAEREEKTACSSCLRMFEASQPVGGRFLGGNRGITARCHTPKYSAYRDINRSRGKTDRQSCGLSAIAVQDERADALTHTQTQARTDTDHAARQNEHQQIWSPQLIHPQQSEGETAASAGVWRLKRNPNSVFINNAQKFPGRQNHSLKV